MREDVGVGGGVEMEQESSGEAAAGMRMASVVMGPTGVTLERPRRCPPDVLVAALDTPPKEDRPGSGQ